MLSNGEIESAIAKGEIAIDPFDPHLVKRNSYLLRLGDQFRRIDSEGVVDTADGSSMESHAGHAFTNDNVLVSGNHLILASSLEAIAIAPNLVGVLSGISNVARLGVLVHAASEFINAGYGREERSRVVFELATIGGRKVRLWSGTPICHLAFIRMERASEFATQSARTGQDAPGASELTKQFGHFIKRLSDE